MKLRFFCEQCGTEVPKNTVRCPSCGRYFTAIQCPQCGFRGSETDFAAGCPTCGYMRPRETVAENGRSGRRRGRGRKKRRNAGSSAGAGRVRSQGNRPGPAESPGPPSSLYKIMGIVLVILLGILIAVLLLL
jgi:predicted RNA-binding Zn-ribbon protein involved in translation (DUF1610 family)